MTPSTPAQPSIPPCVAHCTHCLPDCAELIGRPDPGTVKRVQKSVTVFAHSISCPGDGCQAAECHRPAWCGEMERTARVISELEELVQGVVALNLLVLSLLAVAKLSSFSSEDAGQQSVEAASRYRLKRN